MPAGMELAIETSTRGASVALATPAGTASRALEPEAAHASDLLPLVDRLLTEAGGRLDQVQRLYVGVGPGSFTGLRVGAAVALGLARAMPIDLVAVPSVEAVAWAHLEPGETGSIVLDARSGALYAATYQRETDGLVEHMAPTRIPVAQASDHALRPGVLLGDKRAGDWFGVAGRSEWVWRGEAEPNAVDLMPLGNQRFEAFGPSDPSEIRPLYLAAWGA